ncbi:oxidoreductase, short chain dehydrogenase/reductase family [Aspergillus undulatus]|uniref:oxidoreductase, short chain dehydrogenase/reductase family n=1 Tax=Aspergillus undulatus TaxID=1810928 RepID=UPI003CCD2E32
MPQSNFISTTKLNNTRILLIGGTSGIGFAVARASLEQGASVILASSNAEKVENAVSRLKDLYPDEPYVFRIAGKKCDLGDDHGEDDGERIEREIVSLFKFATRKDLFPASATPEGLGHGKVEKKELNGDGEVREIIPINHIIFTAGSIPRTLSITDPGVDARYLRSLGTVRFIGGALVAKHAPSYMPSPSFNPSSPHPTASSIIYTSGGLISKPRPGSTFAVAGIGAVEAFARGLAVDFAPLGIRVNTVSLGPVKTEIFDALGDPETVERILEGYKSATVLGRVGDANDAAESYLGLMRDENVTGALVRSDAGFVIKA